MNRPRRHKIFSDITGSPTRSLLVIASIAVGLFAIGIIATLYTILTNDMHVSYAATAPANILVRTDLIPQAEVDALGHLPGVGVVMGARQVGLRVRNAQGAWQSMDFAAVRQPAAMPLNQARLLQGRWATQRGEIAVDQSKFGDLGIPLGGFITVELPSGKTRALQVVGLLQDLTIGAFTGGGGFFDAPLQGILLPDTLELLEQDQIYDYSGVFALTSTQPDDPAHAAVIAAQISRAIKADGYGVGSSTARAASEHPNTYLINAISGVLFILGLLVLFLSGFLITNTLQSLIGQQIGQIGIMKTLGARRMQVAVIYTVLIALFGAVAFAIASPSANFLSFALLDLLAGKLNFVPQGQRILWPVLAAEAGLAMLMPQLAAWWPIWQGTRISVQEALSGIRAGEGSGEEAGKSGLLHTLGRMRLVSHPMLIALRNTFRRKGRLLLTLTTLTLGGAVFISAFNVQISMGKYMEQIGQYFLADVNVNLDAPYRVSRVDQELMAVPGVARVEAWAGARGEILLPDGSSGESVNVQAPPPSSTLVKPILLQGRWLIESDSDAIVLNELFLSKYPAIHLGDVIRLHIVGKDTDWRVVGFFQFAGKNGGLNAYTRYERLATVTGLTNQAATFRVVGQKSGMTAAEQDALAQRIEARLKAAHINVSGIETGSYVTSIAGGGFAILTAFLLFLAVLTALVGSIGLTGTMSMNVLERTREIGILRAIGASDQTLMNMILVEGMLIGLISYVLGALLAFPISKLLADSISLAVFDAPSNFGFTPLGFGIWLGLVIVLSFAASVIPARNATRLTVREVLAYE